MKVPTLDINPSPQAAPGNQATHAKAAKVQVAHDPKAVLMHGSSTVHSQYEAWPYPKIPIVASVDPRHVWQLNVDYLRDRCGLSQSNKSPRIWITGCGTFQPYTFKLANPKAEILATDLSAKSLSIAKRRTLWHGQYAIDFQQLDLEDEEAYPEGPFDLIECYGVLMNLKNPWTVLKRMAERLSPEGVLRIMVYPQHARQKIFQLKRAAKLCGLQFGQAGHPGKLRGLVHALPHRHVLRNAFDTYEDARNDNGLVDGFLHAGDRGFTGYELGQMIEHAGLKPSLWFHRPWGQPDTMAEALGLQHTSQSFVLNYLDLWHELRTNFIVCLTRKDATERTPTALRPHPSFDLGESPTILSWLGRLKDRVTGISLPSRLTGHEWQIAARDLWRLKSLADDPNVDPGVTWRMHNIGLLLGGEAQSDSLPAHGLWPPPPEMRLEVGDAVPNPMHAQLFTAWRYGERASNGWLPCIEEQLERWEGHADPLEQSGEIGITPYGTWQAQPEIAAMHAEPGWEAVDSYENWHLADEERAHKQVMNFLNARNLPLREPTRAEWTELWLLMCSQDSLTVDARAD